MKKLVTILFLSASFVGVCQSESSEKETKFSIGVNYSIDQTYRVLKDNPAANPYIKDIRDLREVSTINYTAGVSFNLRLTKRLSAETGLLYSKTGYKTKETSLTFGNVADLRRGFVYDENNPSLSNQFVVVRNYLQVPINLRFYLTNNKLRFFMLGGLSTNVHLSEKITYDIVLADGTKINESSNKTGTVTPNMYSTYAFGFGIDYSYKNKYMLRLNPIYRRSITKTTEWTHEEYLVSYGINLGVFYKF